MKIVLTGAAGFLGWHTRLRLHAQGEHTVVPVTRQRWADLRGAVEGADAVIHIAGVNRSPSDDDVQRGNVALAEALADAMDARPGLKVVFANSTQCGNGSTYGAGKAQALDVLTAAGARTGGSVVDVRFPNLFGEHGRPRYNSFIATFVDACVRGEEPTIQDNVVPLLHAQDAAQVLVDALTGSASRVDPSPEEHSVRDVWNLIKEFHASYATGEIPDLSTKFRVDLFNTYRSALFPDHYPMLLTPHTDARGTFVETVRVRGGEGQSSISSTAPNITRGEHFHLRKIERFVVVQGEATIALRRMFTHDETTFHVNGDRPAAIDMPTGWAHNITNRGVGTLITQFWSHELFRPDAPDTYAEQVRIRDLREQHT